MLRVQHRVVLHQVRRGRGLADVASAPTAASAEKRLHSTDIAFKPTEGGWGFNSTFATGYDRIFAKKNEPEAPKPAAQAKASSVALSEQIAALDAALRLGALTQQQYDQAAEGARQRAK